MYVPLPVLSLRRSWSVSVETEGGVGAHLGWVQGAVAATSPPVQMTERPLATP